MTQVINLHMTQFITLCKYNYRPMRYKLTENTTFDKITAESSSEFKSPLVTWILSIAT